MLRKLFAWGAPARPTPPPDPARSPLASVVVDVTDADFDAVVLASSRPVLVDFWAEWCQPCTVLSAWVEMVAREYQGRLTVAALDVDENPQTAERFAVMGLPTLLLVRNGQEITRHVGLLTLEQMRDLVEQALQPPPSPSPGIPA